jgi:hypothetical protein
LIASTVIGLFSEEHSAHHNSMMASISTPAALGNAATPIAARAG